MRSHPWCQPHLLCRLPTYVQPHYKYGSRGYHEKNGIPNTKGHINRFWIVDTSGAAWTPIVELKKQHNFHLPKARLQLTKVLRSSLPNIRRKRSHGSEHCTKRRLTHLIVITYAMVQRTSGSNWGDCGRRNCVQADASFAAASRKDWGASALIQHDQIPDRGQI